MRISTIAIRSILLGFFLLWGCISEYDPEFKTTVNVVVVEGTLTDFVEPQFVKLSRSKSDPLTGRYGSVPLSGAQVELWIDSTQTITLKENLAGIYNLPADFQGKIGSAYQLRFRLGDGARYESSPEIMQPVPAISRVYQQFNDKSLPPELLAGYTSANDLYLDTQDPVNVPNYYRWDWKLWENQEWCLAGQYVDLPCSGKCWEILYSRSIDVLSDTYVNGRAIIDKRIAQIPYYQEQPSLVEIRQLSLTKEAYRYFKLLGDQTQSTGTLVDTPPAVLVGNVRNVANERENVAGYFAASALSRVRYWLVRSGNSGAPIGLYKALHGRSPFNPTINSYPCILSESRTPFKPEGWRN